MSTKRDHKGIGYRSGGPEERRRLRAQDHAPQPDRPDPRTASCIVCSRRVHYVRRTYGPDGRAGHWQHTGDGLAQYRSW